ncbi:MAG TPA: hypothetical protein PK082_10300, partial [Phycisphaerae bacterium]|nr:hypothetical protein [Phycisphaerae bacterium]
MPPMENVWQYPVLGVMLVAAAIADVRRGKIPNWLTYSGVAVGLIGNALVGGWGGDSDKLGL